MIVGCQAELCSARIIDTVDEILKRSNTWSARGVLSRPSDSVISTRSCYYSMLYQDVNKVEYILGWTGEEEAE